MNTAIGLAVQALFEKIEHEKVISNEDLANLNFLFGKVAQEALTIVEEGKVTLMREPSGRSYYRAQGQSEVYLCYRHFCSCPSFLFSVLRKTDASASTARAGSAPEATIKRTAAFAAETAWNTTVLEKLVDLLLFGVIQVAECR
ncbi:MAG: hypothetical protein EZS28_038901 [Streblomastix strix]|uniref:Uncharacterized protein n=1 Tax=Streblomastix strix TaxID=222440 RepID=A0A5J4U6J4_9EUKA|nr:MAG: hypothetical protein EZS28_038901 [Streblomastix strix]